MILLREKLVTLLNKTDIKINENKIQLLLNYIQLLHKWNKAYNLTAVKNPMDMLVKHILDSLVVGPYLKGKRFIDVGTGPGLPGIPLSILRPEDDFTLLDSLGKRIRFLKQVKYDLKLDNIHPVQSRVEDYSVSENGTFDGIVSRAFSSLQNITEQCSHLVDSGGHFYALKGNINGEEIKQLPDNIILSQVLELNVPELNAARHLIILEKK